MPPEEKLGENLIEKQLKSNAEALKGATVADLIKKDSPVYKMPEVPRENKEVETKPKFDEDGFPIIDSVRTYQGDIASAVQHDNLTMSKIALLEQNKKSQNPTSSLTTPGAFKAHLLLGIVVSLLFLGGVGAVVYSFIIKNKANAPVEVAQIEKELVDSESTSIIEIHNLSPEQILNAISNEVTKIPQDKEIRNIILVDTIDNIKTRVTLSAFLQHIGSRIPETLLRNLNAKFFLGINFEGEGKPFIIMQTSSYDIAYSGLLDWEGYMKDDLKKIFGKEIDETNSYSFKDKIIANKDTRTLEDGTGKVIFFYSLIDNNTIVFAKDAETLKEIIDRLRIESLKK